MLGTPILDRASVADTVVALQRETVILVRDYVQHPDQNLVISAVDAPGQAAMAQQLTQAGIVFTQVKPHTAAGAVLDAAYSPNGCFWAKDTGIYLSRTGARLIAAGIDHGYRPMRFWPRSWVRANHAAIYGS